MNDNLFSQPTDYKPPGYPILDPPRLSEIENNYSGGIPHKTHSKNKLNDHTSLTFRLIRLEDRLTAFTVYIAIIWILIIISILALFKSLLIMSFIFENSEEKFDEFYFKNFEIFNFFMIIGHIVGYFYGIQAYTKQRTEMNKHFEFILLALASVNLIYLIIFFYVPVLFITWCIAIFYLILNVILYFQAKELTNVLSEKEVLNSQRNIELL
jgi:hypothetical protein